MCRRKIVTFLCHCPLRNMSCCPHSAHIIRDSSSSFQHQHQHQQGGTTNSPMSTTSPASDLSSTPPRPQPQSYCPKTGKRLFWHKRQLRDPQGAVHWDPLPSKTIWYPCAGYIATHTAEEWAIPLHECEDCPEYFGDSDIESKEVGICGECKRGHGGHGGHRAIRRAKNFQQFQAVSRSFSAPEVTRRQ